MEKKFSLSLLVLIFITTTFFSSISFAATVGDQLTAPEEGWKRYDDRDLAIFFSVPNPHLQSYSGAYLNTLTYPVNNYDNTTDYVKFKFTGTKLIIGTLFHSQHSGVNVTVDDVDLGNFQTNNSNTLYQRVAFMKTDFSPGEHTVILKAVDKALYGSEFSLFALDYIDVDSNGSLLPHNSILDLTASAGSTQIDLSWSAQEGTTSYIVKRSTTEGGPYTEIASDVEGNSFSDTSVQSGIQYYYVVIAVNPSGQSNPSNQASAKIIESSSTTERRALLTIYISGGQIKEYDLSETELSAFLNWYDTKDAGVGLARYAFTKTWNKGPFETRTEYVIFDKILMFDVDEYEIEDL